jgi:hypothetical protein
MNSDRHYRARRETRNPKACDLADQATPLWSAELRFGVFQEQ